MSCLVDELSCSPSSNQTYSDRPQQVNSLELHTKRQTRILYYKNKFSKLQMHIQSHSKSEGIRKAKDRKKEGLFYFYFLDTSRLKLLIQQSFITYARKQRKSKHLTKKKKKKKKKRSAFMDNHDCPQKEPHILSLKADMKF